MPNALSTWFDNLLDRYKLKHIKDVLIFIFLVIIFSLVGFLWKQLFDYRIFGVHVLEPAYDFLIRYIVIASSWILTHVFAIPITYDLATARLYFPGMTSFIFIWHGCSGLKEMAMFLFIMLLFPGPWKPKTWFIPVSLLFIYFVAILRIVFLGIVFKYHPSWFNFLHEIIFNIIFFLIFFSLWMVWVKYFYLVEKRRRT